MTTIYDNWERLVKATLRRDEDRQLARQDSLSSTSSSSSSNLLVPPVRSFSYDQIFKATRLFSDQNLIKRGHSGDFFEAHFQELLFFKAWFRESPNHVVKRIGFHLEYFSMELDFYSRISGHPRFVPLLGYCFDREKFLVYKYMPNRDLSNSLFKTQGEKGLRSLDWITRSKIAIGAAEGLTYLHHGSYPPLAHGDVQARSIFLDDKFEVRLGSLSRACQQKEYILFDSEESTSTRQHTSG